VNKLNINMSQGKDSTIEPAYLSDLRKTSGGSEDIE
jgi:hypothetical protein